MSRLVLIQRRPLKVAACCALYALAMASGGCDDRKDDRTGPPRITFPRTTWDFGRVDEAGVQKHRFNFANTGRGDLVITSVKPDCGCTTVAMPRNVLHPGEHGVLDVLFDARGRVGETRSSIVLVSNDSQNPVTRLSLSATVMQLIELGKPVVEFGEIGRGQIASEQVAVRGRSKTFTITKAESICPYVHVEIVDGGHDIDNGFYARQGAVRVTLDGTAPVGRVNSVVRIDVADETPNSLRLPVVASIRGDILVEPCPAYLVTDGDGATDARVAVMTVASRSGTLFRVLDVNCAGLSRLDGRIEVRPDDGVGHALFTVSFSGKCGNTSGAVRGTIQVVTDMPGESLLVVPIHGYLPRRVTTPRARPAGERDRLPAALQPGVHPPGGRDSDNRVLGREVRVHGQPAAPSPWSRQTRHGRPPRRPGCAGDDDTLTTGLLTS